MSLNANMSRDGGMRATVRVEFRVDREMLGRAIGHLISDAMVERSLFPRHASEYRPAAGEYADGLTKKECEEHLRWMLKDRGHSFLELDLGLDDWTREIGFETAKRLFPEIDSTAEVRRENR